MLHGKGFHNRRSPLKALTGALPAATLSYDTGFTNASVPVQLSFNRPVQWQDGDQACMAWNSDPTTNLGLTSGATVTLAAATTSNSFGISVVTAGKFIRIGAWKAGTTKPTDAQMIWSTPIAVGDSTAPTISTSTAFSGYQYLAGSLTITASENVASWFVANANFTITPLTATTATLSWNSVTTTGTVNVPVTATDYGGNTSLVWNGVQTVNSNQPTAFSFTNVSNASLSTLYTSNTITIAGLQTGTNAPASVSGSGFTYSKNGGAYVAAGTPFTVTNGDTVTLQDTSPSANNLTNTGTLTVGTTSANWQIATPVTTTTFNPSDKGANITLSNGNLTATGNSITQGFVRTVNGYSSGKRAVSFAVTTAPGWYGIINGTDANSNFPSSARFALAHDGSFFAGSSSSSANFGVPANGDVYDVAWDMTLQKAWFRKNGVWQGTGGDPNASGPGWDISACGSTLYPFFLALASGPNATLQAVSISGFTSVI